MASVINQIKLGNTEYAIAASAFAECSTAAGTAAQVATICTDSDTTNTAFTLVKGVSVQVKFTYGIGTAAGTIPTLNVNGTGAKTILYRDDAIDGKNIIRPKGVYTFVYNGSEWELVGEINTVDQSYDAESANAQSGKAVAEAIEPLKAANERQQKEIEGKVITATFKISAANTTITLQNLTGMTKIDWGDGDINSELTHNYKYDPNKAVNAECDYTCKIYDVTTIGNKAFYYCTQLASLTIGDMVKEIGSQAFESCSNLLNIVLSDNITRIGASAFAGCVFTNIIFPNSLEIIENYAFYACKNLTNIVIPDNTIKIGNHAFYSCSSIATIKIGHSVTEIGDAAFSDCDSLTSVVIPDSVTEIGTGAFSGCDSLTSVVIPDSVTTIGDSAFRNCSKLENITIGKNVSSIGKRTFSGCPALRHLTLKSKAPTSFSDYVEYIYYGPTNHVYYGQYDFDNLNSIFVPPGYVDVYKQDIFYELNKDLTQSESTELSDHLDSIIKPDPEVLQMEYTDNLRNGEGKSALLQADSDCQTTGDFGVSFGFGGKYPGRSDAPVETYRVLKALSDIGEPVYFEYSTIKWQLALKNKKEECVNLYDAYQHGTNKNEIYVLTNIENNTFSKVGIQDCYSYVGVNKGKASLTAGAKYYNDAKYSSVFGTQNIVGDNQEQTYNDLVSGSFNIVRSEKNSIIGGKFNNVLDGQLNIIGGTYNSAQNTTTSIIGGRNGNFKDFYNSIGVGYWLEGSGDGKAIFGRTNVNNPDALLIVGNGGAEGRSNAFEVLKNGRLRSSLTDSAVVAEADNNDILTRKEVTNEINLKADTSYLNKITEGQFLFDALTSKDTSALTTFMYPDNEPAYLVWGISLPSYIKDLKVFKDGTQSAFTAPVSKLTLQNSSTMMLNTSTGTLENFTVNWTYTDKDGNKLQSVSTNLYEPVIVSCYTTYDNGGSDGNGNMFTAVNGKKLYIRNLRGETLYTGVGIVSGSDNVAYFLSMGAEYENNYGTPIIISNCKYQAIN